MIVAGLTGHILVDQPARGLEVEHENLRGEQRGLDILSLAGLFAFEQRHHDTECCKQSGRHVGDRRACAHRSLPRQAGDRHQPAHALRDLVEARPFLVGAVLAIGRDAGIDDARIDGLQVRIIDPQPPFHVGAEILDHHIGLLREPQQQRAPGLVLEVDGDAALVAVQILEIAAVAGAANRVAALQPLRRFDLDDIGAPIGELARAGRPRTHPRQIEHGEMIERGRGAGIRLVLQGLSSSAGKAAWSGRTIPEPAGKFNFNRRPGRAALRILKVSSPSPRSLAFQHVAGLVEQVRDVDRRKRVGAFHDDDVARGHALQHLMGTQGRQWAFQPTQIDDFFRSAHSYRLSVVPV